MTIRNYFTEKVAVITGGSRGLGSAVAEALVKRGCKVVIGDILDKEGQKTVNDLNTLSANSAVYLHTDVTAYKDVIALFTLAESKFGGVDIAFLNAGVLCKEDFLFAPLEDDFDENVPNVNFIGVMKCTRVALLHMAKRGGGVIVNTASVGGLKAHFSLAQYAATKHAVVGWTRSLGMLKDICNVRVNAVCPGLMDTEMRNTLLTPTRKEGSPFAKRISQSPTVKIETVVDAVLTLMEDPNRNAQILMALASNGIQVHEPFSPPDEKSTPEQKELNERYQVEAFEYYKTLLDQALVRYKA